MPLPKGYKLDTSSAAPASKLPAGYALDTPAQDKPHQEGFLESIGDMLNPVPAIQAWLNRPGENRKMSDALKVLDQHYDRKTGKMIKPLTGDEESRVDAGMGANVGGGGDSAWGGIYAPGVKAGIQASEGNLKGAAGTVVGGYVIPAGAPEVISKSVPVVKGTMSSVKDAVASIPENHPVVAAIAPVVTKRAVKVALNSIPHARTLLDMWQTASDIQKAVQGKPAQAAPVPAPTTAPAVPAQPAPVYAPASYSKTFNFSSGSTLDPASYGKTFNLSSGSTLDPAMLKTLTQAATENNGAALRSLPAHAKTALVDAVKKGDSAAVQNIVNGNGTAPVKPAPAATELPAGAPAELSLTQDQLNALHPEVRAQVMKRITDTKNKISVLVKYAQDKGIDLNEITPDARQAFADSAIAYAREKGLHDILADSLKTKGKYRGVKDYMIDEVRKQISK